VVKAGPVYFWGEVAWGAALHACEQGVEKRRGVSGAWIKEKKNLLYRGFFSMGRVSEVSKIRGCR